MWQRFSPSSLYQHAFAMREGGDLTEGTNETGVQLRSWYKSNGPWWDTNVVFDVLLLCWGTADWDLDFQRSLMCFLAWQWNGGDSEQKRKSAVIRIQMPGTEFDLEHVSVWILGCEATKSVLYLSSRFFNFYLFGSSRSHNSPASRFLMHVLSGCAAGMC